MANTFEIPTEMRDFAERGVAQARVAFEGVMTAVRQGANAMDNAGGPAMGNVKDASLKAVAFAETNVAAAFDLAQKLIHAKDISEVVALQSEFLKSRVGAMQAQASEMAATVGAATSGKA